ncbi:hypothetical protein GKZ75_03745 [Kocuria indica]|uniref:Uncharacterized protein n=1 Tax=Kocuria marina subsp. indica TaxID=1049583 RepID=A0A6N9QY68_9MICC|nr:hypothetical protein [Kocuria indica]NDO77370.1 hypothetical protein [Kocuria indica]
MSLPVPTLLTVLTAATPAPSPENTLRPGLDPSQVSPGLVGFLMTFLLAAAVVLLVMDFNRRNRRLRYRAQYAEQRAAEDHVGGYAQHDAAASPSGTSRTAGSSENDVALPPRAADRRDGPPRA